MSSVYIIVLSIAFPIIVFSNVILVIMILKMKREQEQETWDRKRHAHTSVACVDLLGSCLVYPILIYIHYKAEKRKDINDTVCTILGSAAAFYMSCIAMLTTAINIHGFYSCVRPFHYFIYLRRKNSKIPFLCVVAALLVGFVSLILTACGHPLFKLKPGLYFNVTACVAELPDSGAVYYYVVLAHLAFWINNLTFINIYTLIKSAKWRKRSAVAVPTDWCGFPKGANIKIAYRLMYFFAWAPFIVSYASIIINNISSSNSN